jgi:hypothetical protein
MKTEFEKSVAENQIEVLYEASQVNSVLLAALKLAYESAARVGYLNAGLSTNDLILMERAIKSADPSYKYKGILTALGTNG